MNIPPAIEAVFAFVLIMGFILFPLFFQNFIYHLFRKAHAYKKKKSQDSQMKSAIFLFLFSALCVVVIAGMSYFYGDKETWHEYKRIFFYCGMVLALAFVGSIFIRWRKSKRSLPQEEEEIRNITGLTQKQISFIKRFSPGAFLNPFIWSICYGFWDLALKSLIPVYGIYIWLNLAINGRRIAWERKKWGNFDSFSRRESIALILSALGWLIFIGFGPE